ncbi:hypothetical protein D3C71_1782240 [compost metagenome]
MVIGVVVFFPYQHARGISQLLQQLLGAEHLTAGQILNLPQLRAVAPLAALPGGYRRQAGLAGTQGQRQAQRKTGQQRMAHWQAS